MDVNLKQKANQLNLTPVVRMKMVEETVAAVVLNQKLTRFQNIIESRIREFIAIRMSCETVFKSEICHAEIIVCNLRAPIAKDVSD